MATTGIGTLSRRFGAQRIARVYALADQGSQGLANVLAVAVLGRSLAVDQFGVIGMTIGIYFFVAGFHRSAIILPYITEHRSPCSPRLDRLYHSNWWWLSVLASLLLSAMLMLCAAAALMVSREHPGWGWVVAPLVLGGIITPPLLIAEHTRRWLYKINRPDAVAFVAICSFVALVSTAFILAHVHARASAAALAWVAFGLIGTVAAFGVVRPCALDFALSIDCFRRHRSFATWLALTNIPYAVYGSATVVVLVGIFDGPLAAAVFTAARTLTNPAISMVSAVDSIDKPRAARALAEHGMPGLRHSISRTRGLLAAMTGSYLAAVALFAGPLLHFAFHDRYQGIENEVRMLGLAFFLFCLNQPSETLLIVLKASDTMFATRAVTALFTLGALVATMNYGVMGMAIGLALAQAVNLVLLYIAERSVARNRGAAA